MTAIYGGVSAAHVSAALGKAGHQRSSEPRGRVSGFVVRVGGAGGRRVVIVAYQDYDHEGDYGNRARELVGRIAGEAFDGYANTLREAGYETENWLRYDGERLGLFVTGRRS